MADSIAAHSVVENGEIVHYPIVHLRTEDPIVKHILGELDKAQRRSDSLEKKVEHLIRLMSSGVPDLTNT